MTKDLKNKTYTEFAETAHKDIFTGFKGLFDDIQEGSVRVADSNLLTPMWSRLAPAMSDFREGHRFHLQWMNTKYFYFTLLILSL